MQTPNSDQVLLVGGPLDGSSADAGPEARELIVTMADRSRHRYASTRERRRLPSGAMARVFCYERRLGPD